MESQKQRFYEQLYERRKDVADNNERIVLGSYLRSKKWSEKLVVPLKNESVDVIYYVHDDELFNAPQEVHTSAGHGGRDRMMKRMKGKYKNIVRTEILLLINLRAPCQIKQKREKRGIVSKLMIFNDLNSRCQVDLIDYQSHTDGKYRFVLVYQDHLTKFVILRSLETKCVEEVAYHLVDILTIFGAPVVLQSDNGREFCNRVIGELNTLSPELKLLHGKPCHSQSQDSVERAN